MPWPLSSARSHPCALAANAAAAREVQKPLDLAKQNQERNKELQTIAAEKGRQEKQLGSPRTLNRWLIAGLALLGMGLLALLVMMGGP